MCSERDGFGGDHFWRVISTSREALPSFGKEHSPQRLRAISHGRTWVPWPALAAREVGIQVFCFLALTVEGGKGEGAWNRYGVSHPPVSALLHLLQKD